MASIRETDAQRRANAVLAKSPARDADPLAPNASTTQTRPQPDPVRKYELVADDTIEVFGIKLFRIRAIRDFGAVKAGDLGGYVESEENLSHDGEAWVSDEAQVFDKAQVLDEAQVSDWAQVSGWARVRDRARVSDRAWVGGRAQVLDEAQVSDWAWVTGKALVSDRAQVADEAKVADEARVCGEAWVCGRVLVCGEARASDWEWQEVAPGIKVAVPTLAPQPDPDTARSDDVLEVVRGARDSLDRLVGVLERSK